MSAVSSTNIGSIICKLRNATIARLIIITLQCRFYVHYFWWYTFFVNTVVFVDIVLLLHVFRILLLTLTNHNNLHYLAMYV